MSLSLLPRHTFRWWLRPMIQRMDLNGSGQYAQGIRWSYRLGPIMLAKYAGCSC